MYPTTEVRWFHRGGLPSSWRIWLESCPDKGHEEPLRTDKYLLIDDFDGLGIKIRQGRLEIKRCLERLGAVQISDRVHGFVEYWAKWSFELAGDAEDLSNLARLGSKWVDVRKRRILSRYLLVENGRLQVVPYSMMPPDNCEVELTELWVNEQRWGSLAFEAAGPIHSSRVVLMAISRLLLANESAPKLNASSSFSYPRLLVEMD